MVVVAQSVAQLGQTVDALLRFLPQLLGFAFVLAIGYVLARVLVRAVDAMLGRVGFERAVQRSGIKETLARSGTDARELLTRVVFVGLMLFVLQLAFAVFGPNPVSALLNGVIAFLPRLFVAVVIVVLAAAIAAVVRDVVDALIGSLSYGRALAVGAYGVILGIGVFAALDQLQIAPTIVNGLFYALLAVIVGVTVVAVGGGGIAPMRQRWERALARMDDEAVHIRQAAQQERERRDADERDARERIAAAEREEREHQAQLEREERERIAAAEREERERRAQLEREARERQAVTEFGQLGQRDAIAEERRWAHDETMRQHAARDADVFGQIAERPTAAEYDPFDDGGHDAAADETGTTSAGEPVDPLYPRPDDRRRLRSSRRSSMEQERPPIRYRGPDPQRHVRPYMTADADRAYQTTDTDGAHRTDAGGSRAITADDAEPTDADDTRPVTADDTHLFDLDDTGPTGVDRTQPIEPGETRPIERTPWDQTDAAPDERTPWDRPDA